MPHSSPLKPHAVHLYRSALYHPISASHGDYYPDGGLAVNGKGEILSCGVWADLEKTFSSSNPTITVFPEGHLIMPGLVDMHVHLPQIKVTGRQKSSLMTWLEEHIFPAEKRFSENEHARQVSQWFFRELLKNGTTTANVFTTIHTAASHIAFETAKEQGNRIIMGLNLMDRHAPEFLLRKTDELLLDTETLYQKWHGVDDGRLLYAWAPRFAISCSDALLSGIGELRKKYPTAYCHTHISEQKDEVSAVLELFPKAASYTDVYDGFGLLGEKTILAHGIYLDNSELARIQEAGVSIAHCPSANFFLHSGLFRWFEVQGKGVLLGLGSDVGAGPELNLFKVMKDAQYTQSALFKGKVIDCQHLIYHGTLGGAKALGLDHRIGNFESGKEADFLVLDLHCKTGIPDDLAHRELDVILSSLVFLGDDRLIQRTYVRGREVYRKS